VISRIMGEGQYDVADAEMDALQGLDQQLEAAVDGSDEVAYRRRWAADSGAVLALTHHTEAEVLAASLDLRGPVSPSAMLAALHAADPDELARLAS
jgi:hypothetical protein